MERFTEQAVVLSTVDYGESDRLVSLFTRGRGKLSAFAAGARKSRRRFGGALQPLTLLRAQLVETRGDTFRLDSVEVDNGFYAIREDLTLISRGLYCAELCRELVRDREPHPQLFVLLVDYVRLLDQKRAGPTSLLAFELEALAHAGLMPRFGSCSLCGGPPGERPRFDPEHGGVVCEGCAPRAPASIPVAAAVVRGLHALQEGARVPLPAEVRQRARELLNVFISHHVGRRLKSVDFMSQLGVD